MRPLSKKYKSVALARFPSLSIVFTLGFRCSNAFFAILLRIQQLNLHFGAAGQLYRYLFQYAASNIFACNGCLCSCHKTRFQAIEFFTFFLIAHSLFTVHQKVSKLINAHKCPFTAIAYAEQMKENYENVKILRSIKVVNQTEA